MFQDTRVSQWMGDGPDTEAADRALFGLGTEVAEAIVTYGFGSLGVSEVHATVAGPNAASPAVLAELGFEHVRDIDEDEGGITRVLTRRPTASPACSSLTG